MGRNTKYTTYVRLRRKNGQEASNLAVILELGSPLLTRLRRTFVPTVRNGIPFVIDAGRHWPIVIDSNEYESIPNSICCHTLIGVVYKCL